MPITVDYACNGKCGCVLITGDDPANNHQLWELSLNKDELVDLHGKIGAHLAKQAE